MHLLGCLAIFFVTVVRYISRIVQKFLAYREDEERAFLKKKITGLNGKLDREKLSVENDWTATDRQNCMNFAFGCEFNMHNLLYLQLNTSNRSLALLPRHIPIHTLRMQKSLVSGVSILPFVILMVLCQI